MREYESRVYMLMSARYYSIAHAYESIFEIHLQFILIFWWIPPGSQFFADKSKNIVI